MSNMILVYFMLLFGSISGETVKFSAIMYRHGARTPVSTYPTDPWGDESLWPVKFGQLTNLGKTEQYQLGKWLRQRYEDFISESFGPTEVYIMSTDMDRTLMSAEANLAGFYPPKGESIWNKDLLWQPIPVHTVPIFEDEVLAGMKPCPAFNEAYLSYRSSKEYKDRLSRYQGLMDYLTTHTGKKIQGYFEIQDLFSIFTIEQLYNLTLPKWADAVFPDKMLEPAGLSFTEFTATPAMARLKLGPILQQIIGNMQKAMTNEKDSLKMSMYSAHDLTVASFLNALGMYNGLPPPFAATMLMELLHDEDKKSYDIRISYQNSTEPYIDEPYVLEIPNCGYKCPISKFIELYDDMLTLNWQEDCYKTTRRNGYVEVEVPVNPIFGPEKRVEIEFREEKTCAPYEIAPENWFYIVPSLVVLVYGGYKLFSSISNKYKPGYNNLQNVPILSEKLPAEIYP